MQLRDFASLSVSFWLLCLLHMLFSNCSHLFSTISTDFIVEKVCLLHHLYMSSNVSFWGG